MTLYIRHKPRYVNFVHNIEELRTFELAYIPHTHVIIGDVGQFSQQMKNKLLKLIEENPEIDCYSSQDISDAILLSRFVKFCKEPVSFIPSYSQEEFFTSDKSYMAAKVHLDWPDSKRLLAKGASKFVLALLQHA